MPFDENGFLGDQASALAKNIFERHKTLFALCYEINRFAEMTKFEFSPHSEDRQELVSTCLYIKFLEGIQAVIILAKAGLDADAQIVLRGAYETLIHLVLCVKEKDYSYRYLMKYDVNRLALLKKARERKESDGVWAEIYKLATEDEIKKLEKEIEEKGITIKNSRKEFKIKQLAKKAKLEKLYDSFYTIASDYAHANPLSLKRYVTTDKEGIICQLNHGPCDHFTKSNLVAAFEFSLVALSAMCELFKIDKDSEIKEMHDRLKAL